MHDGGGDGEDRAPAGWCSPPIWSAGPVTTSMGGNGELALGVRVEQPDGLLEDDGEADGGDERGEPWGVAQRPVGEPFLSTATPTEAMIAPSIMSGRTQRARVPWNSSVQVVRAPKPPIMKISPWAKLMSWTMP